MSGALHHGDRRNAASQLIRETAAEATALVICPAIGLETGPAASDYIQLWNGDAELLRECPGYVRQAVSQVLTALTMHCERLVHIQALPGQILRLIRPLLLSRLSASLR